MTTIKAHFDGKSIILDQAVNLPIDQPLTLHVDIPVIDTARIDDQLNALDDLLKLSTDESNSADWSRDSIYSGTLDDPR